jgi:hypothetical protein
VRCVVSYISDFVVYLFGLCSRPQAIPTVFYRMQLFDIVKTACYQHFHRHIDEILADLVPEGESVFKNSHIRRLFFGNYMEPDADPKIYDEVSLSVLGTVLHKCKYQI